MEKEEEEEGGGKRISSLQDRWQSVKSLDAKSLNGSTHTPTSSERTELLSLQPLLCLRAQAPVRFPPSRQLFWLTTNSLNRLLKPLPAAVFKADVFTTSAVVRTVK
jgi:hypothetical protein